MWLAVLDNISTVEKLGSEAPWQDTLDRSQTFIRSKSKQTSSCPGAIRNRQPGPKPRYFIISGHRLCRCETCKDTKKPGSVEKRSPDQMYHPVVPPSGGWRRPFRGNCAGLNDLLMPSFRWVADARKDAPKRRHIFRWISDNEATTRPSRVDHSPRTRLRHRMHFGSDFEIANSCAAFNASENAMTDSFMTSIGSREL